MNALETKFQNMSKATKAQFLLTADNPTVKEDSLIDRIYEANENEKPFCEYAPERKTIKALFDKGLVIPFAGGYYAIAYLCNL